MRRTVRQSMRQNSVLATAHVLATVPADWTEELSIRRAIREASNLRTASIAQRLNHLIRRGQIERRQDGPIRELRSRVQAPENAR